MLELHPATHYAMQITHARYTPHRIWNVAAEHVGHWSLSEAAVFLLGKDANTGESAQQPVEWRGLKTFYCGNFLRGFGTALDFVGQPQLGRHANNLCDPATGRQLQYRYRRRNLELRRPNRLSFTMSADHVR
jgi:hypothetical protein